MCWWWSLNKNTCRVGFLRLNVRPNRWREGGKLFPAPERWQGNELLLPVIVPLPSRTLTPFQTIGGAATTIQWRVCDVETFASWTGGGKKRNGSGAFFSQPYQKSDTILLLLLLTRQSGHLIRRTGEILQHPNPLSLSFYSDSPEKPGVC